MTDFSKIVDIRVNTNGGSKTVDYYVDIDDAIVVLDFHQAYFCAPGMTEGFPE